MLARPKENLLLTHPYYLLWMVMSLCLPVDPTPHRMVLMFESVYLSAFSKTLTSLALKRKKLSYGESFKLKAGILAMSKLALACCMSQHSETKILLARASEEVDWITSREKELKEVAKTSPGLATRLVALGVQTSTSG